MLLRNGVIFAVILIVFFFGLWFWGRDTEVVQGQYDEFAQCLASQNVTMYGADWCPYCNEQQKRFGSSWKYVPYVECPENVKTCVDAGIEAYPTWIFADGTKLLGNRELSVIAQESGCPLPTNN